MGITSKDALIKTRPLDEFPRIRKGGGLSSNHDESTWLRRERRKQNGPRTTEGVGRGETPGESRGRDRRWVPKCGSEEQCQM